MTSVSWLKTSIMAKRGLAKGEAGKRHELSIAAEILGRLPPVTGATGEFQNGIVTGLTARLGENEFTFSVSVRAPRREREIALACRDGSVGWTIDDEHAVQVDSGSVERLSVDSESPLSKEIRVFLGYLEGGPPPKTSAREGAASVALLEEIRGRAGITPNGRRAS